MKVLMISAAFPPVRAGESDHALQICRQLADAGADVHVLTTRGNEARAGLPFRVWPIMKNWSWLELPRLGRLIRRVAPDSILLMYSGWIYRDHPMITYAPTIARRLLPSVRFVTQFETEGGASWHAFGTLVMRSVLKYWTGSPMVDSAYGTLLRDSDQLILLSEGNLERFEALLPRVGEKSVVIPPPPLIRIISGGGAVRSRGRALLGASDSDFLLMFFGYVDRNKGIETLYKAVEIVGRRYPHVRLVMVGGGRGTSKVAATERGRAVQREEAELLALPEAMGIADRVTWTPGFAWDSDDGSLYLRATDAAVLPFDAGITLNRSSFAAAAAHGLPIITTRGPSLESAFRDGENCLLCPPKDPEALALAIQSVVEDVGLRERLRLGSEKLASEWFSWGLATEKTLQALRASS